MRQSARASLPGAFSHPCVPSVHPYILMNFQGKVRDVMTLAHELGHGVHQVLAGGRGHLRSQTPLTLAETASVFGEMLTFRALLDAETGPGPETGAPGRQGGGHAEYGRAPDFLLRVRTPAARPTPRGRAAAGPGSAKSGWRLPAKAWGRPSTWTRTMPSSGATSRISSMCRFMFTPTRSATAWLMPFTPSTGNSRRVSPTSISTLLRAGGTLRHRDLLAPFGLDARDPAFWGTGIVCYRRFIGRAGIVLMQSGAGLWRTRSGTVKVRDRRRRSEAPFTNRSKISGSVT